MINDIFEGGSKGEPSYDEKHYNSGIVRILVGKTNKKEFKYYYVKSQSLVSKEDIDRILSLKIPPAWTNVWISGNKNSAIQVVGLDTKNRKQYKYSEKYTKIAEKKKFLRLYDFIK